MPFSARQGFFHQTSAAGGTPWTPDNISPDVWFDSQDTANITATGGVITRWASRVDNTDYLDAVGYAGSGDALLVSAEINGYDAVHLDETRLIDRIGTGGSVTVGAHLPVDTGYTVFYVYRYVSGYSLNRHFLQVASTTDNNSWQLNSQTPVGDLAFINRDPVTFVAMDTSTSTAAGTFGDQWNMVCNVQGGRNQTTGFGRANGKEYANGYGFSSTQPTMNMISLGCFTRPTDGTVVTANQLGVDAKVTDIIMFSSQISQPDVENLEGWAAHKYGLQSELPADHPYKNSPPLA